MLCWWLFFIYSSAFGNGICWGLIPLHKTGMESVYQSNSTPLPVTFCSYMLLSIFPSSTFSSEPGILQAILVLLYSILSNSGVNIYEDHSDVHQNSNISWGNETSSYSPRRTHKRRHRLVAKRTVAKSKETAQNSKPRG